MPKFIIDIPEEYINKMREVLIEDDFYDEEEVRNTTNAEVVEEMLLIPTARFDVLDIREGIGVIELDEEE